MRTVRARVTEATTNSTNPTNVALTKVPQVTLLFWVTKVLTTGMGETTSDYLTHRIDPAVAAVLGLIAFAASMVVQFATRRYVAWAYWLAVVMVSVFGTMAADAMHVKLGIPYVESTAFYVVVLAAILGLWYRTEGTLSIHSIYTRRREAFYWATVLATFALGTAVGDMTAITLHLGYFSSGVMFAVLIAIPALAHWRLRMNAIFSFWFAYVLTRPLGASFADWLGVTRARGGLGYGTLRVSIALLAAIVLFVAYLASRQQAAEPDGTFATLPGAGARISYEEA